MKSGIYRIVNVVNGHCYVGSSAQLNKRKQNHFSELRSNRHDNRYLQGAFRLYGEGAFVFDVLEYCSEDLLFERESFYLGVFRANGVVLYNIGPVGKPPSWKGRKHKEESKRLLSAAHKGMRHTEEACRKMSKQRKGRSSNISEAGRKRLSEFNRGRKRSLEARKKMSESKKQIPREKRPMYGRRQSEEAKRKIREANRQRAAERKSLGLLGRPHSLATREKMRQAALLREAKKRAQGISGYPHTQEAKEKIGRATKARWAEKKAEKEARLLYENLLEKVSLQ